MEAKEKSLDFLRRPYILQMSLKRPAHRPLIIGHRGLRSDTIPENSLAAFEEALNQGADGIECDVRLGRDDLLFCRHDRLVDGQEAEMLSAEQRTQNNLPLFEEVLGLMDKYPDRALWIESKTLDANRALINTTQPRANRIIISFSDQATREAIGAGFDSVFLNGTGIEVLRDVMPIGSRPGPSKEMSLLLTDDELSYASVWTVDDTETADILNKRSVWALTTNYPARLLDFFSS